MANLYITEQNAIIRKTGNRLIVKKDKTVLLDVPCHKVGAVLIFGNVQFTTQVVHEMMEHGIEMAILTRNGRLIGQLTSPFTKNAMLRIAQFRKFENDEFKLKLSQRIVKAKIKNSLNLIKRFSANHPEIDLKAAMASLKSKVDNDILSADTIGTLLGVEGTAARIYFAAFGRMLIGAPSFEGRKKRPPTDPVNAILSFSYTIVFNEIASLLDGLGFDPYVGFFHKPDYGRASLAADLIEEFRAPLADRLTLNLFNRKIFVDKSFKNNPKNRAVYLTRKSMKRYFAEYEKIISSEFVHPHTGRTTTLRKSIRKQAHQMAATIMNDTPYEPFELTV